MTCGWILLLALFVFGWGSSEERKAYYVGEAREYLADGNYPKARVALSNAAKINPQDANAIFLLANVAEKEEHWQQAFNLYLRIVELEPTHRGALSRLARFYLAWQKTEQVADIADTMLSRDPQDDIGQSLQAAVLSIKGQQEAALVNAKAILDRKPTESDALILLAAVLASNAEPERAHAILQRGLAAQPDDVDLLNYLATTYVGRGAYEDAEGVYLQLLSQEPHVFRHRENLARIYQQLQKPKQAVALLRDGVELDPTKENRWKSLVLHTESSQREALIQEALQTLPHSMVLQFLLAEHYEQYQESDKARVIYEAISLEEEPSPQGLKAEVQLAKFDFVEQKQQMVQTRLKKALQESPR